MHGPGVTTRATKSGYEQLLYTERGTICYTWPLYLTKCSKYRTVCTSIGTYMSQFATEPLSAAHFNGTKLDYNYNWKRTNRGRCTCSSPDKWMDSVQNNSQSDITAGDTLRHMSMMVIVSTEKFFTHNSTIATFYDKPFDYGVVPGRLQDTLEQRDSLVFRIFADPTRQK